MVKNAPCQPFRLLLPLHPYHGFARQQQPDALLCQLLDGGLQVLDNVPKCPKAGDDGGQAHRYPAYDLGLVELLHLRIPTDI
jgi:hypothetical protein